MHRRHSFISCLAWCHSHSCCSCPLACRDPRHQRLDVSINATNAAAHWAQPDLLRTLLTIFADGCPDVSSDATSTATPRAQPCLPRTGHASLADMVMMIQNTRHLISSANAVSSHALKEARFRLFLANCCCCKAVSRAILPACTSSPYRASLPSIPNAVVPSACGSSLHSFCNTIAASTYRPAAMCTGAFKKSAQLGRRTLGEGTVDNTWRGQQIPEHDMLGNVGPPSPSCFQRGQCFSLQIRAQQGAQEGLRGRAAHMCSRGQCKGCG
mmetsp:Transcript_8484/g.22714  ORF Transcript_8484/g.22714 Transcript_8484/m.22714 type:complete len:269 (-) Transcript_8484:524-1330(-)